MSSNDRPTCNECRHWRRFVYATQRGLCLDEQRKRNETSCAWSCKNHDPLRWWEKIIIRGGGFREDDRDYTVDDWRKINNPPH